MGKTRTGELKPPVVRDVYQSNDLFDPGHISTWKVRGKEVTGTNIERMQAGRAPIGLDGKSIELHHLTQNEYLGMSQKRGALVEVLHRTHKDNYSTLHFPEPPRNVNNMKDTLPKYPSFRKNNDGTISTLGKEFDAFAKKYWQWRGNNYSGG